jgi:hypothetical protein
VEVGRIFERRRDGHAENTLVEWIEDGGHFRKVITR